MIETLAWDSQFFNLNVGKLELSENSAEITNYNDFDVVYVFVDPNDIIANNSMRQLKANLVDEKVTYYKDITSLKPNDQSIELYVRKNLLEDNKVIQIGMQSNEYSRFNIDKNFERNSVLSLYSTWMSRSIARALNNEIFISRLSDEIAGVVTLVENSDYMQIGLIAVDSAYRGLGIGNKLINACENYSYLHKVNRLKVTTQKSNLMACKFYEKMSFKLESAINVYHYWPHKTNDGSRNLC